MSTDRTRIEATLRQLQAELAESPEIDPAVKQRLAAMQAEILNSLANSPQAAAELPPTEPISLTRRLADAALYFEESHPSLSTTIGSLAGILGQMGL
ncbi:MAG TPA: DUF4404 family protein [Pirellulales bacterium]|jgi:hypothetical protein|nr:DUF4404 family protein [Pirellulales bacterium]